jgi:DmsE family decaheme c-type cytochrome
LPTPQMTPRRSASPTPIACLALVVSLVLAGNGFAAPETSRVSEACLSCHAGQDSTLAGTAHQLPRGALDAPAARVACTDCHPGDRRHWEDDPAQNPLADPAKLAPAAEAKLCLPCHQKSHQQNMRERNVHAANDVACSACHSVHRSKHPALLRKAESGLCLDCHGDIAGQLARPSHHPVAEGAVKCSDCHMTLDATRRAMSWNGASEVCFKCHAEFQGPFPYQHPATLGYSTDEGGCMACHEPHGANLPRMLKQPYEAPNFQLCTQCHSVPRHNANSMHGTRWAGKPCNDCHVDVHGSFTSRLFLSESLRGCFNAGCHQQF